ncbi:hypothetical protein BRC81_05860 [Halobacteriales archaeon QS_1_68_20]|nr:MAG: hypothetical protein BRC81_05860 [Halobacteriales archaeon QS_1_68_20]
MRDLPDALVVVIGLVVGLFFVGPFLLMVLAVPAMGLLDTVAGPGVLVVGAGIAVLYLGGAGLIAWWLIGGRREDGALEELRLALARGEITEEEYERRRELLEQDRE